MELAGVIEGIAEMVAAHLVQGQGQLFHRDRSQLIEGGMLSQDLAAGSAEDVGEGLEAAVGTSFEEEESREVAFFSSQVLDQVEAEASIEA
jgi:hypothetical protein